MRPRPLLREQIWLTGLHAVQSKPVRRAAEMTELGNRLDIRSLRRR